ncbi:F-box domain-containing protein [Mycena sanguinolenta]|uniref:F-box domain-containing protein n=1 Tax=Mycena sanguinolenta TaxID=230812 RepID=A0A8H7DJL1_9AGAR|nr:F-box domain-containing protein [Mycena sanguinolenta]
MATLLRARIAELSLAIETQKQILRDLEKSRSDARRDLNATLDPMARLPVEISSDIFARCLPDSPRPHSGQAPMLFLNVCHLWRDIATSASSLWTSIYCESSTDTATLDNWLRRARSLPLHISLPGDTRPDVAIVVNQHAHHLEVLELGFQHLKDLVSPCPSLAKLTVINTVEPPTHRQCMDILHSAPALVECEFISTHWQDALPVEDTYTPEPFTHPVLRHLRLSAGRKAKSTNAAYMLEYLTLPALETLSVSDLDIMDDDFASFLTRSSPPLRSLHLGGLGDDDLVESFRLVPTVTDLSLKFTDTEIDPFLVLQDSVFASDENLLPNLRNLRIRTSFRLHIDHELVISALAARRASPHAQLESFMFLSLHPKPRPDITVALRQLAEESGIHIHIGPTTERNYI